MQKPEEEVFISVFAWAWTEGTQKPKRKQRLEQSLMAREDRIGTESGGRKTKRERAPEGRSPVWVKYLSRMLQRSL